MVQNPSPLPSAGRSLRQKIRIQRS
jgi:hypothetical protein